MKVLLPQVRVDPKAIRRVRATEKRATARRLYSPTKKTASMTPRGAGTPRG